MTDQKDHFSARNYCYYVTKKITLITAIIMIYNRFLSIDIQKLNIQLHTEKKNFTNYFVTNFFLKVQNKIC